MVVINRGESNTFVMTLNENVSYSSPEFLFVLYDKIGRAVNKFFLTDTSTTSEYNKFTFTEGTDETINRGDYTYKVYEKENQDDEDIPSDVYLLEEGILRSKETILTKVKYSRTDASVAYGDD